MKINEKLTQQEIADRVGSSREMVARTLKDLTIGDYIEVVGRHTILNKKLPESYSGLLIITRMMSSTPPAPIVAPFSFLVP
jgi:hypothetical protein